MSRPTNHQALNAEVCDVPALPIQANVLWSADTSPGTPAPPLCRGSPDASPGNSPGGGHISLVNKVTSACPLASTPDSPQLSTMGAAVSVPLQEAGSAMLMRLPGHQAQWDPWDRVGGRPVSPACLRDIHAFCRGLLLRTSWERRFSKGELVSCLLTRGPGEEGESPLHQEHEVLVRMILVTAGTGPAPSPAIAASPFLLSLEIRHHLHHHHHHHRHHPYCAAAEAQPQEAQ